MQIQWLGQSCFKIQAKTNRQEIVIATDPYGPQFCPVLGKFSADIVTVSHDHDDHNNLAAIKGEPFVITEPGEYEIKEIFIYGLPGFHDNEGGKSRGRNIIYRFTAEDLSLVHLGDLGHELSDEQLDQLGNVDILFVPVGGGATLDAKTANKIVTQIEPRLVIPMHYQIPGLKIKLNGVEEFLKICGLAAENTERLKINKKDLPAEETKVVILKPLTKEA